MKKLQQGGAWALSSLLIACSSSGSMSSGSTAAPAIAGTSATPATSGSAGANRPTAPTTGAAGTAALTSAQPRAVGSSSAGDGGAAALPSAGASAGEARSTAAGSGAAPAGAFDGEGMPWMAPAPRATCGAGDMGDDELQGASGDRKCNLALKSRIDVAGMGMMTAYKDCAYVDTSDSTVVLRVAEDGTVSQTAMLNQVGFQANWESLKATDKTGLLAGYESLGSTLAVADISKDCAHPEYLTSFHVAGSLGGESLGHSGNWNPDGTIYYPTSLFTQDVSAIDLTDPHNPKLISNDFAGIPSHDLFIGKGGTRAYMASAVDLGQPGDPSQVGSVAIMDTSEIQARKPGAKATLVHMIQWEDGNATQYPIQITYRGRDYLMVTDELGSGSCGDPMNPIWGYARIVDIQDEQNPSLVSLIRTEAQHPDFCMSKQQASAGAIGFGVGTHYCNVDREQDPRVLACGTWAAGLRVYDIRNPWKPRELAYFDVANEDAPSLPRVQVERREIWYSSTTGFYVIQIVPGTELDSILAEP